MSQSYSFYFGLDDKVIGVLYLSLFKDILQREGCQLRGYSGPVADLTDYRKRVSPRVAYQTFTESLCGAPAGIGFKYGEALNLVAADSVGQLIMSCPDVRQAFLALQQFHPLLSVSTDIRFESSGDVAMIDFGPGYGVGTPDLMKRFTTESVYTALLSQVRWLTGAPLRYRKLYIPYSRPAYSDKYEAVFDCDIHYGASTHRIEFDTDYFDLPIITANEQIRRIKSRHCADTLRRWESRLTIENRIKAILLRTYPDFPSLEEVASRLHTSRSCLYRKLRMSQTSYQGLINEFKRDKSLSLLRQTSLTVPEIAAELGFSDASSFRRAFKSWTGYPPSAVRG